MESWRTALENIRANGFSFTDDEGRVCHEIENFVVTVNDLSDIQSPLQWIRGQADWYYPSDEELRTALFSHDTEEVNRFAYGSRIFHFRSELNQLDDYVIPLLQKHPDSRRALVALADPVADEVTSTRNFVSLLSVWFRLIKGRLCTTMVVRSNDFLLGWPANIYQARLLQEYVAQKLGVSCGTITSVSLSAHYFSDEDWLREKLMKK
jgi:thymidylate synthase